MDRQELFNAVAKHLLTQKQKSEGKFINPSGEHTYGCAYRGLNGLKCAVGGVIPDEMYKPEMEGRAVNTLFIYFKCVREYLGADNEEMLSELQWLHDSWVPKLWPRKLRGLAAQFALSPQVIDELD